jgi:hypothetical protein
MKTAIHPHSTDQAVSPSIERLMRVYIENLELSKSIAKV